MSIIHRKGPAKAEGMAKVASAVIYAGGFVTEDGSGNLIAATSSSTYLWGVSLREVAATDDDYAGTNKIQVLKGGPEDVFECTVTGTLTTAMVGNTYDISDAKTVNVGAQSKNVVLCVGFISTTKGLFKINPAYNR